MLETRTGGNPPIEPHLRGRKLRLPLTEHNPGLGKAGGRPSPLRSARTPARDHLSLSAREKAAYACVIEGAGDHRCRSCRGGHFTEPAAGCRAISAVLSNSSPRARRGEFHGRSLRSLGVRAETVAVQPLRRKSAVVVTAALRDCFGPLQRGITPGQQWLAARARPLAIAGEHV
jgi:hypothetical protein